jgi:23S rRNA (cytosine1962-C5)-methyltransferase
VRRLFVSREPIPALAGHVVVISRRAAERLRAGHVWVYRSDIEHLAEADAGLIAVADHRGFPLGTALWSPASQIALRLLTSDPHLIHEAWLTLLQQRMRAAIRLRAGMMDEESDACRLVFSEADQLPGLIVDQYGDLILFEILSKALDREDIRTTIVEVLRSELAPVTIVERSDARIRELEQLSEPSEAPLYCAEPIAQLRTIFHLDRRREPSSISD